MVVTVALVGCGRPDRPLRVVLLTLDTLRYDSFAGSVGGASTMPLLRSWAEHSMIFDRFYTATASTQPTHASMFTGLHPWQHGVSGNGLVLAENYETISEDLRQAGFSTVAVVASFPLSRRFGFAQGFEEFDDEFVAGRVRNEWLRATKQIAGGTGRDTHTDEPFYSLADVITERALATIETATAQRQFFWFHYFDPHDPYGDTDGRPGIRVEELLRLVAAGEDPKPAVEEARRLYDEDVTFLDRALGRLLERLEQDADEIETHIVVAADHGESFGEEGSIAHGRRLIPSQIHVPCIIRSPRLGTGVRNDVAGSVDIAATLLAMAGVDETSGRSGLWGSRDLTQPPPSGRLWALGMRRTYEKPYRDLRLDGSVHILDDNLFFLVGESGEIFRGNGTKVIAPAANASNFSEEALQGLFGSFEEELARSSAQPIEDPEAVKALRTLGYTG